MEKVSDDYLKKYKLTYKNRDGNFKVYEAISREDNLTPSTLGNKVSAVMIVPYVGDKILLSKEFRMAVNDWVYNFPAGLVDKGETIEEAAVRELKEETGLKVTKVVRVLSPSFSSVGISDEKIAIVIVEAEGEIVGSDNVNEEIESSLYTKEELINLINECNSICSRTQLIGYWLTSK